MATLFVRLALGFAIDDPLLELFLIPIMISAYIAGLGPGLVATALAAAGATYFVAPPNPFLLASPLLSAEWGLLIGLGILISWLNEALHHSRRRAEASRRLQAVTLASIGDAVITTDAQGRVTFLNAEAERLTGWPNQAALGQPLAAVFRIINSQTRTPAEDPAAKVLRSGMVVGLANHTVLIARDGRETPIDDSGAPIRHSDGALLGVVLVFRDIAERERAEAALHERERKLSTLLELLPIGISILDAERHVSYTNPALKQIVDLSDTALQTNTFTNRRYLDAAGAPMPAEAFASARALREDRAIHNVETGIVKEDGRVTWTHVSAVPTDFPDWKVVVVTTDITERKQAEQALRASEANLRIVADTAGIGLALVDASHRYQYSNRTHRDFLNLPDDDLAGQRVADILGPIYTASVRQRLERAFAGEAVNEYIELPISPGKQRHFEVGLKLGSYRAEPVVVVVLTDVTERILAQEQLRYQADLIAQVPDAIISTDASFVITSWNAAAEALYGWTAQDVIGKPMGQIVQTEYREGDAQLVRARFLAESRWRGEVTQQRRDGTQVPILSSVSLLKDRSGNSAGAVAVNRDITERRQAELALQRFADRLQHLRAIDQSILISRSLPEIAEAAAIHIEHLIPATRVGVTQIDLDAQIMSLLILHVRGVNHPPPNRQMPFTIFGAAIEALIRGEVYHVDDIAALPEQPAFIRSGQPGELRTYFQMPIMAGRELIALLNVGSDQPSAFTAEHLEIAREVADQLSIAIQQVRLRAQVEQHAQELEQRVADRTAELTAANKELEAFSYSVSHDLRAPLRAIDGFSRILLEDYVDSLPGQAQTYFRLLRGNAQQMGQLVDDLLAFSRLSRQPLTKRDVEPAALVRQCLDELRGEQAGRRVEIAIGDLPACQADPALLKQVWINLLANALKYTRRRDPAVITIGSRDAGGEAVYYISDNGVGFDMRYSDKLFGVFQRMHRAEDYEGTGVGLAIVQRIILRHGGHVWADAAVDQGATFFFTFGGDFHDRNSNRDPAG